MIPTPNRKFRESQRKQELKDRKLAGEDWTPLEEGNKKSKKLTEYL